MGDTLLLKWTKPGGRGTRAVNDFVWPRPSGKRPGKWTERIPNPVLCQRGYHLTTAAHWAQWANVELWVAEGRGVSVQGDNKVVFESARLVRRVTAWDERGARLFAADVAERVLPIFERERPGDDRPRLAIAAARDYANGTISAAAWAAAAAAEAAWAAKWAAAYTAERGWQTDLFIRTFLGGAS